MYDTIIVGSGAAGATLALSLTRRGHQVLVVEAGRAERSVGSFKDCARYFDTNFAQLPRKSKEGTTVYRTLMAGGSTMVSCANGTPALRKELRDLGFDIGEELRTVSEDLGVVDTPESMLSNGTRRIRDAAAGMGLSMRSMPKFFDPAKCRGCGLCSLGCSHGAHWTAEDKLKEAVKLGAEVRFQTSIERIETERGKAAFAMGRGRNGPVRLSGRRFVLCAGGIGSPIILQNSGITKAGGNLFVDLFVNTYGMTEEKQNSEPQMSLVCDDLHDSQGFVLSPFVSRSRGLRMVEAGPKAFSMPTGKMIGLMTKITDEPAGRVYADGSISKPVTDRDWDRLDHGSRLSREILTAAGADPDTICVTRPMGAHPGGTAALGTVVDTRLQTEIEGLTVCDASILPDAPGLPPTLTIVAAAEKLAADIP